MLFLGGSAISQFMLSVMGSRPSDWKFGFAYPVSVGVLLLLDARKRLLTGLALLALAVLHLVLDYRSFAGFFLLAALAAFAKGASVGLRLRVSTFMLSGVAVLGFGALYSFTSRLGTLEAEVSIRRMHSNAERAAGIVVGYQFVRASPILGYGSWPRSDEALETWAVLQSGFGTEQSPDQIVQGALESPEGNVIRTHSMILQAWVEAGIIGLVFFVFSTLMLAGLLVRLLTGLPLDRYYALGCFFGLWGLWAFIASPFAGVSRLNTAISIVLLFVLTSEDPKRVSAQ
jgi:O-antigen ligase